MSVGAIWTPRRSSQIAERSFQLSGRSGSHHCVGLWATPCRATENCGRPSEGNCSQSARLSQRQSKSGHQHERALCLRRLRSRHASDPPLVRIQADAPSNVGRSFVHAERSTLENARRYDTGLVPTTVPNRATLRPASRGYRRGRAWTRRRFRSTRPSASVDQFIRGRSVFLRLRPAGNTVNVQLQQLASVDGVRRALQRGAAASGLGMMCRPTSMRDHPRPYRQLPMSFCEDPEGKALVLVSAWRYTRRPCSLSCVLWNGVRGLKLAKEEQ